MATPLATAFVRIRPDTSGFGREMQSDLNKSGKSFAKAGQKQGGLFRSGFSRALTAGGGLLAAGALFQFGKTSVKAFSAAQQAQTRLQDAFARFPKLADSNITAFQNLNTELQKKTKFDDEAFASGQAVLAQFGLTGKQILKVTPTLADYAAKIGKDVPIAAKLLGKASLGNARALKDLGINFKATGDQSKDMATVIKLVQERVGGFAEKEGRTAAGQAKILSHQFEEVQEKVGAKLVPALTKLAGILLKVVDFVQRNSSVILPLAAAIVTVVSAIKIWRAAQIALNIVLATNPIVLIVAALAGLAVGLVIAYKKSETFRKIVDAAFRAVRDIAVAVFNWIKRNWPLLLGILTGPIGIATVLIIKNWRKIYDGLRNLVGNIRDFFTSLPGKITRWIGSVGDLLYQKGRDIITGLLHGIWNAIKGVGGWIKARVIDPIVNAVKNFFGIHSPSTVFAGIGGNLVKGLIQGIIKTNPVSVVTKIFGSMPKALAAVVKKGYVAVSQLSGPNLDLLAKVGGFITGLFGTGGGGNRANIKLGQAMAANFGWVGGAWDALKALWMAESGWNERALNESSGAYGIPQSLPASKMASAGSDWRTNPATQIAWGLDYIWQVYGNPINAYQKWLSRSPHWYGKGGLITEPILGIGRSGRMYGFGERGPETVTPGRGGNSYYINVNVPPNANQHEIGRLTVESIKAYERGSGTKWRKP